MTKAIAMKIRTEFQEDSYNIYTEEVEQGFCEPCFFIQCLSQSEEDKLSERFLAQHSFVISYFPKKGNEECWQVQKRLQYLLYYITLEEGSLLRGTNRKGSITEGVLQFFVNYDFPMKYRVKPDEKMEVLKVYGKTKRSKNKIK